MYSCFSLEMWFSNVMTHFFLIVWDLLNLKTCQLHYLGFCCNDCVERSGGVFPQPELREQKNWKEFYIYVWSTLNSPKFPYNSAHDLSVFSKAIIS